MQLFELKQQSTSAVRRTAIRVARPVAITGGALLALAFILASAVSAKETANSATIIGPSNVRLSDGASELEAGHIDEGLRLTLEGLKEPADARDIAAGHANACAAFVMKRDWQNALDHCNQSIALDSTNWRAFNNRAAVYVEKGLFELAIRDIQAGLELAPNSRTLHESLRVAQRNKRIMEGRGHRAVPS